MMGNHNNNQFIQVIKSYSTKTTSATFKHNRICTHMSFKHMRINTTNMKMKNMDPIHKYSNKMSRFTSLSPNKRLNYYSHVQQHKTIKLNINHGNNKR